jgi:hypothetical protein
MKGCHFIGTLNDCQILKNNCDPCSHVEVSQPLTRTTKYHIHMKGNRLGQLIKIALQFLLETGKKLTRNMLGNTHLNSQWLLSSNSGKKIGKMCIKIHNYCTNNRDILSVFLFPTVHIRKQRRFESAW